MDARIFHGWLLGLCLACVACSGAGVPSAEVHAVNAHRAAAATTGQHDEFAVSGPLASILTEESSLQVARAADGRFVVLWLGVGDALFARLYTENADPLGPAFMVVDSGQVAEARVAMDAEGQFVVAWRLLMPSSAGAEVMFQHFDAVGNALGPPQSPDLPLIRPNVQTPEQIALIQIQLQSGMHDLALAMNANGDFVIGWNRRIQAGICCIGQTGLSLAPTRQLIVRPFFADGTPVRSSINVAPDQVSDHPALAMDASGGFVVTWRQTPSIANSASVFRRHYSATGHATGPAQQVVDSSLAFPALAMENNGRYVLLWTRGANTNRETYIQRFESDGSPSGPRIEVIDRDRFDLAHSMEAPALAMAPSGDFAIAWSMLEFTSNSEYQYALHLSCHDANGVEAQQLVVNRHPLTDRAAHQLPAPPAKPTLAFDGYGDLILAWHRRLQQTSEVRARRVEHCR